MKLGDIIALAKLGYKKDDIQELINMADTVEDSISTEPENRPDDEPAGEPEVRSPEPVEPEKSTDHDTAALKALEDQIADLKKQLEAAQKTNINIDNSGSVKTESDQDILNNVMRNFM